MAGYDRDEVLAHTDLVELATELCGEPRGQGRGAKWHCPNPEHPDEHPSMTVFNGRRSPRWHCHSCGEGGTAIDMWMTVKGCAVGDAIADLGARAALARHDGPQWRGARQPEARSAAHVANAGPRRREQSPVTLATPFVHPDVEAYVERAIDFLWGPPGEQARTWLRARGLGDEVLRANRVGFDPGRDILRRAPGLPHRDHGRGVVYPALAPDGAALYVQLRYLDPAAAGRDKYDNPSLALATNPRVAAVRIPAPDPSFDGIVVVTEGIPDGLAVAHVGAPVAAVIGAGNRNPEVAQRLHETFPVGKFVILWDADAGGRTGASLFGVGLAMLGRDVVLSAPPGTFNDINDWWRAEPAALPTAIASAGRDALYRPNAGEAIHGVSAQHGGAGAEPVGSPYVRWLADSCDVGLAGT